MRNLTELSALNFKKKQCPFSKTLLYGKISREDFNPLPSWSKMRVSSLFLAIFVGYGCAAKKLAVKNADIVLEQQIQKRLPLYMAQREVLSKDIDSFLNEQKSFAKEAIPIITSMELDVKKVDEQYGQLAQLYQRLALNFSRLMSKHMAVLDEKQQKEFIENLQDENRRLEKSDLDERLEKIYDRFELLFDTISDKQKEMLKKHKLHIEERHKLRLKRRKDLHQKFAEIYGMDLSQEAKAASFYEAFVKYQKDYPEDLKNIEIIKEIIPTLTVEQKNAFEEKTEELKELLNLYLESNF